MRFTHTTDVATAAWIRDAVLPWPTALHARITLASLVPGGYPRLVAVPNDPAMPWALAEVDPQERPEGTLAADRWRTLAATIEDVHGAGEPVTTGLWTGCGTIVAPGTDGPQTPQAVLASDRDARARTFGWITSFDVDVQSLPVLELPHREYALFRGTTATLRRADWQRASGWAWAVDDTFHLCWPDDRSWFAYSDTDLTQLYLGCDGALADAVLRAELGATDVQYSDASR